MRLVHLSDLHLGARHSAERMERLSQGLRARFKGKSKPVLVLTGDLVDQPFGLSNSRMAAHLRLLKAEGFTVLAAPGNHDYGPGSFNFPPCASRFRRLYLSRPELGYPSLDLVEDTAFIGLDSNAGELNLWDLWGPGGEIGKKQLLALEAMLEKPEVRQARHRVLYMHHHPDDSGFFMGLKDWKELHRLVDRPGLFSAVLFGHRHLVKPTGEASRRPLNHIPRVYDGGASLGKKGYAQGPHRLMDLDEAAEKDEDLKLLG